MRGASSSALSIAVSSLINVNHRHRSLSTVRLKTLEFDRYRNNPVKYWNDFYKRHQNKVFCFVLFVCLQFFKDRHYLEKDWGQYFCAEIELPKVVLEVGCGVGNSVFPLLKTYPNIFVHACDLSSNAIDAIQSHADFRMDQVNPFVCDVTSQNLSDKIVPSSVDIVTLIFTLSAVSPEKMPMMLQNLVEVLKPNGYVLLRDYAVGDFSQVKLHEKNQMIDENFYARGDGTCSFYFSEESLSNLFTKAGFKTVSLDIYSRQIMNRSKNITMNRHWIRAIFRRSVSSIPNSPTA
ncbi:hypothetical protein RJ641_019846 [Dillenia turbinata]|uniref:tRNA N(3)-methylcytidine methyltransferase n=1 Tax=Dillenia turbinata TaxID=194707 RepID=A0AAN8YTK5_9MAGN